MTLGNMRELACAGSACRASIRIALTVSDDAIVASLLFRSISVLRGYLCSSLLQNVGGDCASSGLSGDATAGVRSGPIVSTVTGGKKQRQYRYGC
jgi:hypothetical protein